MEAVSWAAVVMAAVSMIQNVITTISNNRTKSEMAENELKYAKELEAIRHELADCRDAHATSEADRIDFRNQLTASELDRGEIRMVLAELKGRVHATEAKQG